MKKLKIEPNICRLDIKPPYAISDKLFDKFRERIKGTDIEDVTPWGNFLYGNKTGAIWLRVEVDQRYGMTVDKVYIVLEGIFKNLRD